MSLTSLSQALCFGATVATYSHLSEICQCTMRFAVIVPPQAAVGPVPVLYWLSGLTCNEENFITKAGAQCYAAEHGVMIVAPDTSPRGTGVPDDSGSWDMGQGAGFYVDALALPWGKHYQMYSYVTEELPALIAAHFSVDSSRQSIMGHSMGGHGALVCALRNPDRYRSVSAFAPIAAPSQCPWGEKIFGTYLGGDRDLWHAYDATELVRTSTWDRPIVVDQGTEDSFLETQLRPELLAEACKKSGKRLTLRMQQGYDHSYYFIATFIGEHIAYHARALQ
jgi:S-formylglutathione hydrolase